MTAVEADIEPAPQTDFRLARSGTGDNQRLSVIRVTLGPDGAVTGWDPIALSDMDPSDMAADLTLLARWAPTAWIDVVDLDTFAAPRTGGHLALVPTGQPGDAPHALPVLVDDEGRPITFLHGNPAQPIRHIARPDGRSSAFGHQAFCGTFGRTDAEMFDTLVRHRTLTQVLRIMSQYRTREICRRCDAGWLGDHHPHQRQAER